MKEKKPLLNTDPLRRYSYDSPATRALLDDLLDGYRITPESHPRVVDLAAGDGSMAAIFHEYGWLEENITCVDICESPTPLVSRATWIYEDLYRLAYALSANTAIASKISDLRHSFDIVTIYQSPLRLWEEEIICRYLARNSHTFVLMNSHTGYLK